MIYVISLDGSQIVKIGHGGNPRKRVMELQVGSPTPLILEWVHEGDVELENHLHAVFKEYRIRGEWFDLSPLGNAVQAIQGAISEAPVSLLKAPRFRGPAVAHAAVPVVSPRRPTPSPVLTRRISWQDRFAPLADAAGECVPAGETPKAGCIRAWEGRCLRPTGMSCDC